MQYFLLQNSSITQIDEDSAKMYFKKNIYHTNWKDVNWENITIFDEEKNSVIPYVKFLDSPVQTWGFALTTVWALVALALFFITLYFVFWNEAQDEVSEPIINPLITAPVSPAQTPITVQETINTQNVLPVTDDTRRQYEEEIHLLKLANSDLSNTNNIITERYNEAVRLREGAKQDLKEEIEENLRLREEIKILRDSTISQEQTRLINAWKKILEICERTATPDCLQLFFND